MARGYIAWDGERKWELSAEEAANFEFWHVETTDPGLCNCSHAGLERVFHFKDCPVMSDAG